MESKHRIIRVWPFWPEGLKYHDHYLTEAMAKDGVETMFAYPHYNDESYSKFEKGDSPKDIESNSYSVFFLRYLNIFGKPFPFNGLSFINRIKDFKPNVVHIFGLSNFTTYFVLACLGVLRFKGTLVFNDHSDPTEKKTSIIAKAYYLLFKILYHLFIRNRFPVVVPDGGSERELIIRYGESIKTVLRFIPLGFDSNSFNLGYGSRSNHSPLVIGFAGKISSSKRIEALLTAVEGFCEKDLEVRICGFLPSPDDYQKSLIEKIVKTGVFKEFILK